MVDNRLYSWSARSALKIKKGSGLTLMKPQVFGKKSTALIVCGLFLFSLFSSVSLAYADAPWGLTDFSYRKLHQINQTAGAGTDYQINITAYYGAGFDSGNIVYLNNNSQSDFDDVRFTSADGVTLLSYWRQNYFENVSAVFWLKLDANLTATNGLFYIYYGNSTVSTLSNQTATFIDILSSVVLAYPFSNGAGSSVTDFSGFNNTGTLQGAPSWTTGKYGYGLSLNNATSDYISAANTSSIDVLAAPLSVSAWVHFNSTSTANPYVLCKNLDSAATIQYAIYWDIANKRLNIYLDGAVRAISASNSVLPGGWTHVGFAWNGSHVQCFVNGSASGSAGAYSGSLTSRPNMAIGRRNNAGYVYGLIDEVNILKAALNSSQFLNLASYYGDPTLEAGKILIRQRTTPEPVNADWGTQEYFANDALTVEDLAALVVLFSLIGIGVTVALAKKH